MWNVRTLFTTGLVALTIAGTTIATVPQAEAHDNFGAGVAVGAIGGALVGSALTAPPVYAAPRVVYTQAPPPYSPVFYGERPLCHVGWHENHFGEVYPVRSCRM